MIDAQETQGQELARQASFDDAQRTIAHISDLHIGKSKRHLNTAKEICRALIESAVDKVIVTGDITQHGLKEEYRLFKEVFTDIIAQGKLLAVPGNHDRWGDDVGRTLMDGVRVDSVIQDGACLIRIDSTEPRNRIKISGHGSVTEDMMDAIMKTVLGAAQNVFVVIALHHHLLPQHEDMWIEKVSNWFRLPFAKELRAGQEFIERLRGKCDIILHGHRHSLKETLFTGERDLAIYNAGSTTMLRGFRIFSHQNGVLASEPKWVSV